jgi:hypothetical protein
MKGLAQSELDKISAETIIGFRHYIHDKNRTGEFILLGVEASESLFGLLNE